MGRHGKDETAGLSRRELLQRSAVAGGIVWAAPTLLASTAGAQTVSCPEGSCPVYHRFKIAGTDPNFFTLANMCSGGYQFEDKQGNTNGSPCISGVSIPGDVTLAPTTCETFKSHIESVTGTTIVLKPGYQFVAAFSKKGSDNDDTPQREDCFDASTADCRTATFVPAPSHIEIIYCGPS